MSSPQPQFQATKALQQLWQQLEPQLTDLAATELLQQLSEQFERLQQALESNTADAYPEGQQLLCLLIGNYPQFTPLIERQLLWFFGGDCLHFLSDEEIRDFQQAEEAEYALRGNDVTLH